MLGIHFLTEEAELRVVCGRRLVGSNTLVQVKPLNCFVFYYQLGSSLVYISDASLCTGSNIRLI